MPTDATVKREMWPEHSCSPVVLVVARYEYVRVAAESGVQKARADRAKAWADRAKAPMLRAHAQVHVISHGPPSPTE